MPIHNFGPLKNIEDAEKEVEEGKAQKMKSQPKRVVIEDDVFEDKYPSETEEVKPKIKVKANPPPKSKPPQKKMASHPMVHGMLEIEEEEL